MSEMVPEGWGRNTIGVCCEILDSQRIPLNSSERANRKGDYPYYGANSIQGYIDDFIFDGDAILVAEDGGNFDQYADRPIAQWVTGKYWVNNHAHILRARENDTDKWVFYSLVHKNILKFINGGTRAKLNQSDLREIEILSPPLPEQKKIVSILTSVDEVIEKTQSQIDKLQDLKKGTMNELLTKGIGHTEFKDSELGRIPKSWEVRKFQDICKVRQGLQIPISERHNERGANRFPYLTVALINSDFSEDRIEYIESPNPSVVLKEDEFVVARTGAVGKIFSGLSCVFHNNFFAVKVFDRINKSYLMHYLRWEYLQEKIQKYAGTTTIPDLNHGDFYSLYFLSPPVSEQERAVAILDSLDSGIEVKLTKLHQTQSLKKSLMQDLLTGKVRVSVN